MAINKYSNPVYAALGLERRVALPGSLKRFLALPCTPSYWIYAEAAVPALMRAWASEESPDPKEFYHRASGRSLWGAYKDSLRSARGVPLSASERRGCSLLSNPEDAVPLEPVEDGEFTRFLFEAGDWIDQTTWYIFLASIARKGLINWSTNVLTMANCKNPGYPGSGSGEFWFGAIYSTGVWGTLDFQYPDGCLFAPASPSVVGCRQHGQLTIAASASFSLWLGPPVGTASRIIGNNGVIYDTHKNFEDDAGDPEGSNHVWTSINIASGGGTIAAEWYCDVGHVPTDQVFPNPGAHCYMFTSDLGW